jgi:hypothetical protein
VKKHDELGANCGAFRCNWRPILPDMIVSPKIAANFRYGVCWLK